MAEFKWYVMRAVSGQEKKIKSYIETEVVRNNVDKSLSQVLIPVEKVMEVRNGKKRTREKNFFPGYILIEANLEDGELLHTLNNIPGVLGFLGAKKGTDLKPEPIRQAEANRILGRVEETFGAEARLEATYLVGELITVNDGPFSGFQGTVEEVFDERKKLNVMVKIFGRNTPVELSYAQVEKQ